YLHRITDPRMGGISLLNLSRFKRICGDQALKNVVIVTTRWDEVRDIGEMEKREKELMHTKGEFFEPVISAGAQFLRHDNTFPSICKILEKMLHNHPVALQIQIELSQGKTIEETAAGAELRAEIIKLQTKHEEEMEALRKEMETNDKIWEEELK